MYKRADREWRTGEKITLWQARPWRGTVGAVRVVPFEVAGRKYFATAPRRLSKRFVRNPRVGWFHARYGLRVFRTKVAALRSLVKRIEQNMAYNVKHAQRLYKHREAARAALKAAS